MFDLKILKTTSKYIKILNQNGIFTIKDLLQHFPRDYENREAIKTIDQITIDTKNTVKVKVIDKKVLPRGSKKLYEIICNDDMSTNNIFINFFNSYYQSAQLEINKWYIITGKAIFKYGKIIFNHPEISIAEQSNDENYSIGRIYPIYPEIQGIKPGRFARKIWGIIDLIPEIFQEHLPQEFLKEFQLLNIHETIKNIHFPDSIDKKDKAVHRIFFDRLLRIQLVSLINKSNYKSIKTKTHSPIKWDHIKKILSLLPFNLTNAQKKVTKEIIEALHKEYPMLRLLQGDVGSGKTIVAAICAYHIKKEFDAQSVFLAPLEILAAQHYKNLAKLFLPLGLRIEILTGSTKKSQKDKIKSNLKQGNIDILIGTHAILQEDVSFKNLQLAIIDEQHKFGVKQRAFFKKFGNPHLLQMSATPIPRSMALAFFGEFDISVIDEMPSGRKPIHTKIISEQEFTKLKPWIISKIHQGQKVFIVTPLIEESDKLDNLKAATIEHKEIKNLYNEIQDQIGLLHGKIKSQEKEEIMTKFKEGKYKILVSTTVIEVGVDIPEATIMIIKNSERFGLSQLHQLRGRIGRSSLQSYCFLETKVKNGDTYKRLKAMEETNDGFKLAELDLQYRGAGEILGVKQSGDTDVPLSILTDIQFLNKVQTSAQWLLQRYPNLEGLDPLKNHINTKLHTMIV